LALDETVRSAEIIQVLSIVEKNQAISNPIGNVLTLRIALYIKEKLLSEVQDQAFCFKNLMKLQPAK